MPPDRGRAPKACTGCRAQKTRCYPTADSRACLRCERIGRECSFETTDLDTNAGLGSGIYAGDSVLAPREIDHTRFERLEKMIASLLQRVDLLEGNHLSATSTRHESALQEPMGQRSRAETVVDNEASAPLFVLRDATTDTGLRMVDRTATNTPSRGLSEDIIVKRLLSPNDAFSLLVLFQEHYGRWVLFDADIATATLLEEVRKSPLLLTACCLIAVRHTSLDSAQRLAPMLFREAKLLLSNAMLNTPQPLEFFQSALVLSNWSTTIGTVPLGIDSWLLSGLALQHSIASGLFKGPEKKNSSTFLKQEELNHLCIYNHVCLVHLHYCVGTRRKAMIDRKDLEKCRAVVDSNRATNFETRMVAEVFLYMIIYENCNTSIDSSRTQTRLQAWKEEWQYLFNQPRPQFIQMGFYFAQLLTYEQSFKTRSAAARESLLNEMVRLSTTIINLAMDTADARTPHLTDHIFHTISFAAVTLSRLLHSYETQLSKSHDLLGLDGLIFDLVSWLHAVGPSGHVAHTMGDVVAAFHKKLRPESGPSPSSSYADADPAVQNDFSQLFPEFFGASPFEMGYGNMLPEYHHIP